MSFVRRVQSAIALGRANFVPFERPDRVPRAIAAALPWGIGTAGLLAAGSARYPTANALIDDEGPVTYADLWSAAKAMGNGLRAAGARGGTAVGVMCRNHRGLVIAAFATAIIGADLVLLNTGFAGPQLADVVSSESISMLIHDDEFAGIAEAAGITTIGEAEAARMARGSAEIRPPEREGRVVILTSGTTGRPKGAARRADAGAAEGAASLLGRIPLRARDVQIVCPPLFHAWGLSHLMLGLSRSATTIVSRSFDPAATIDAIDRHHGRVLVVVPVMLQRMLAVDQSDVDEPDTTSLEVIASSGSALGGHVATATLQRFGPVLYNTYGSTEIAVASVATPADLSTHPTTVGRTAPSVRVEILDETNAPVPAGTTGRIFVGNAGHFDGYTGGGTKETQRGLLSSGDVGHFDAAGLLFVDGRDDDMVISGGENLFPGEVEELLLGHPAIADAAVVGVPDADFGQVLAAFVVRRAGQRLGVEDVRSYVRSHLARFKVPKHVTFVTELPRTTTGKILRDELRRTNPRTR